MSLKGGSYQKNKQTGELTLVSRTKSLAEAKADAEKKAAVNQKSTKKGDKS